ncbi:MAG: AMP-binding protein [Sandaracinaceae bacterium]|nr:AMP-binding protein [Sandaracinaceae bacterium]
MLFPRLVKPTRSLALRVLEDGGIESQLDDVALAIFARSQIEALLRRSVFPGEVIGIVTEPCIQSAIALLAGIAGGYVVLPLDPKLGPLALRHILADARPRLIATPFPERMDSLLCDLHGVEVLRIEMRAGEGSALEPRPLLDTASLLLYTSGTTSTPKGVLHSSKAIAACIDGLAAVWNWTSEVDIVHSLPLFHVHGLVLGLFGAIRRGGALHWLTRFSPEGIKQTIEGIKPPRKAVLFAVPTMYHRLAQVMATDPEVRNALASTHMLVSGSAPLPLRDAEAVSAQIGKTIIERYGMTETLITLAVPFGVERAGHVGWPIPGVEVRLVDEKRQPIEVADGLTPGEIAVRGPTLFLGYLNQSKATKEAMDEEGWFYTGDLAVRAPDGAFRIVGRRSTDLIKSGGYRIGSLEVEAALLEHPQVLEAAVIGAPDPDLGERIVAFVVVKDPINLPSDLDQHVARLLSPHKRPREVHFVTSLPRNAMGKIQKSVLREWMAKA